MFKFVLSGFSDEIDSDIIKQFEGLQKLNISYFEPRGINGKNISELSLEEAVELKKTMDEYKISASSIGSPIGKISINDDFEPHVEKFKHVLEIAKIIGAKYIRIFSFYIPEGEDAEKYKEKVLERLSKFVVLAEEENIVLLHENEKDIYGDIPTRCAEIISQINSPCFKAVFDPANFVQCGIESYPEAFNIMKQHIQYMHIKDALATGEVVPAGSGEGKIREILTELKKESYVGFLSLEPHLGSFVGLNELEISDDMLKLEKSGIAQFELAFTSLYNILEGIK